MKKFIITILSILLCSSVSAATYNTSLMKSIAINGFIKTYCIAFIYPIEENSDSTMGIPFSIMGNDISYQEDKRLGREVARWSIATNLSNIKLTLNATPLQSDSDASVSINYYLTFRLSYVGEDSSQNPVTIIDYITVESNSTDLVKTITNLSAIGNETLPVISLDQDVRFMLYDYTQAQKEAWPAGFFSGNVTLTLEGT